MITKLDISKIRSTNNRLGDISLLESAYHVDTDDDYMELIFDKDNYRWQSGLKLSEFNPFSTNLEKHYIIYFLKSKVVYMNPTELSSDMLVTTTINLGLSNSFISSLSNLISKCQVNSISSNIAVDYPMSKPKATISYVKPVYKDQAYGQGLQT